MQTAISMAPFIFLFFGIVALSFVKKKRYLLLLLFTGLIPLGNFGEFEKFAKIGRDLTILPIVGAVMFLYWSIDLALTKRKMIIATQYRYLFGFIILLFASLIYHPSLPALNVTVSYLMLVILLFLSVDILRQPRNLFIMGWVIIISLSLLAGAILLTKFGLFEVGMFRGATIGNSGRAGGFVRYGSSIGDTNLTALQLSIALPFIIYYFIGAKNLLKRVFLIVAGGVILFTILLASLSLTGIVGLLTILLMVLLRSKGLHSYQKSKIFQIAIFAFALLLSVVLTQPAYRARFQNQLDRLNRGILYAGTSRIATWFGGAALITHNPILGVGLGPGNVGGQMIRYYPLPTPNKRKGPHNTFLYIGGEIGIIGLFFFMAFIYSTIKRLYRSLISSPSSSPQGNKLVLLGNAIFVSLVAVIIQGLAVSIPRSTYLWLLLGLSICYSSITRYSIVSKNGKD